MGIFHHNPDGFFGSMDSMDWKIFEQCNWTDEFIAENLPYNFEMLLDFDSVVCDHCKDKLDISKGQYIMIEHLKKHHLGKIEVLEVAV